MDRLTQDLKAANLRLKSLRSRCTIENRGDRLILRGTFPPKPTASRQDWHRQRIFIGVAFTPVGISHAETEARKISALLDQNNFDWSLYINEPDTEITFDEWIAKFKAHKLAQGINETTWHREYEYPFKTIDSLDPEKAIAAIFKTEANTRKRSRYCMAISSLFKFAGVEIDLKAYKGSYSATTVQPREIPTDASIQDWYFNIKTKSKSWAWAFGMLATYGIRPEELVLLVFEKMPILIIRKKAPASDPKHKFQDRLVYPIFPEWVKLFDLENAIFPKTQNTGKQACKMFKRYKVPFLPYDLRHAWAIRSMEFGLPLELAAQQMGHSMTVHSQTYHRWISDRHHKRAFDTIMLKSDRLKPPELPN